VGYSPEAITNYIAALNKLNDATLTEAQQAQILKEAYEKLSAGMEKAAKKIDTSISASVTRTVSLVMAFNSLINAINSIIDLTEEWDDLSTSEKISKILGIITSVAMVLPSIIKSIKEANIVITETSVATTGLGATIAAFVPYIAIIVGIGVAIYELYDAFHDSRTEAEKLSE
jgi:phage-related minor tail protein